MDCDTCSDCGKEFNDEKGTITVGITGGTSYPDDGFHMCDGDPWEVICRDCHAERENKVAQFPELLEACKAVYFAMMETQGFAPNFLEQAINKAERRG